MSSAGEGTYCEADSAGLRRGAARPRNSCATGSARLGSRARPRRSREEPNAPEPGSSRVSARFLLLAESARALSDRLIGPRPRFGIKSRNAAPSSPFGSRSENGRSVFSLSPTISVCNNDQAADLKVCSALSREGSEERKLLISEKSTQMVTGSEASELPRAWQTVHPA